MTTQTTWTLEQAQEQAARITEATDAVRAIAYPNGDGTGYHVRLENAFSQDWLYTVAEIDNYIESLTPEE